MTLSEIVYHYTAFAKLMVLIIEFDQTSFTPFMKWAQYEMSAKWDYPLPCVQLLDDFLRFVGDVDEIAAASSSHSQQ